jgi:hypothetical protein
MFTGIPYTSVDEVWKDVLPWIEPACKRGGLHRPSDIYQSLIERDMQLWIYRDAHGIAAVGVTEIRTYPLATTLDVIIGTGRKRKDWENYMLVIEQWAASQGCKISRPHIRWGWLKTFKKLGYRITHVVVEKIL